MKRAILSAAMAIAAIAVLAMVPAAYAAGSGKKDVTFNFVDVEISNIAKFISEITGKNFIYDDRVRGKITIIAPSKLSSDDAYDLFTAVLQLKGFALLPSGVDTFKIVPVAEVKQSGVMITNQPPPVNDDFIARLIPIQNISADDALRFLQPVISRNGYISAFGPGNLLLVLDSGINMKKILDLVEAIDRSSTSEEPEVVFLKHSSAEDMARMLNEGIQKTARKRGQADQAGKAVGDNRLNAVILFGDKGDKDSMKRLIALMDVEAGSEHSAINVYFLENGDAEEIAKVLNNLASAAKGPKRAPNTGPDNIPEASITPDKGTNSLVIVASPTDYASLLGVIKQLDRRRRQVFVEAMIVEASVDQLRDMGAKWRGVVQHNGEPVLIGGVGTIDQNSMNSIITGLSGMSVGGMSSYMDVNVIGPTGEASKLTIPGFAALFNLSEFKSTVNVLSSPQILTSDNTEAEIIVGENVPFVTRTEGSTATTNLIKSIERKDVGISLKIKPQITEGDYVKLDIYQEISSVKDSSEAVFTEVGPTTTKRSTKTSVVVRDNQTVVIGGLIQEQDIDTQTRVPLLHRIPILGSLLFNYKSRSKVKTNLLVFLTPNIIKETDRLSELSTDKMQSFARAESMYVEGQLLVKFSPGTAEERINEILKKRGAKVLRKVRDMLYLVQLKSGRTVSKESSAFANMDGVEYAEPNYVIKANP